VSLLIENINKESANNLPLGLRIGDPLESTNKSFRGINSLNVQADPLVRLEYPLKLMQPEQSVVNKDTGEVFTYCPVQQNAATDESTPPDKPSTTLSFPSWRVSASTVVPTNESGVHF
jgi:hypothetical protein